MLWVVSLFCSVIVVVVQLLFRIGWFIFCFEKKWSTLVSIGGVIGGGGGERLVSVLEGEGGGGVKKKWDGL